MSAHTHLFEAGAEAFKQKRYLDAIQYLETFCQSYTDPNSNHYIQARVWLVNAYQGTGQLQEAIALCQQLSVSSPPKIQSWAKQKLPSLQAKAQGSMAPGVSPPRSVAPADPDSSATPTGHSTTPSSFDPPASSPPASFSNPAIFLTPDDAAALFSEGNKALRSNRFQAAVDALEQYCRTVDPEEKGYGQAQQSLVKAYQGNGQLEDAIALCKSLLNHPKDFVRLWAEKYILRLDPNFGKVATSEAGASEAAENSLYTDGPGTTPTPAAMPKAGRSLKQWVKLSMRGVAGNLVLASTVTLALLFGMVLVLSLALLFIQGNVQNPTVGLAIAVVITLVFNGLVFLVAPFVMDLVQGLLYGTQWVSLYQIEQLSPETARTLRNVCQQKKLQMPRLGLIADDNPTAFTYGSFPNSARLVVSRGLFTYLDDDEAATVYAHELGHIVHWDFAVMTIAATLVQITYLIYVYAREVAERLGDSDIAKKIKGGIQGITISAYLFYVIGEYLVLYLSRTREYYADHFAAEVTGNPNGLSRALVKIAYGILEEGQRSDKPSKVIQGTRALGISDPRTAVLTGTAYRVASAPQKVGKVFLWDMFNPWGGWTELNSTHPLTGKRIRALTTYAEQLGLEAEFDMAQIIQEGRRLNKKRLYGTFVLDVLLYWAEVLGGLIGLAIGIGMVILFQAHGITVVSLVLFGLGIGILFKTFVMYPSLPRIPVTDVLTLMSDPYASPLRGQMVKLNGRIIGRGDAGNLFGSDFQMQDKSGMVFLHYSSRFGPLGNFLFGTTQADGFLHKEVAVVGWFRRSIMPRVDLMRMDCPQRWTVHSYHRFWAFVSAALCLIGSFVLLTLAVS